MNQCAQPATKSTTKQKRHYWPSLLNELVGVIEYLFMRRGQSEQMATELACLVVAEIAHYFGGQTVYLPRDKRLQEALRDRQIWQRIKHESVRTLAKAYGLSEVRIYDIIKKQKALQQAPESCADSDLERS